MLSGILEKLLSVVSGGWLWTWVKGLKLGGQITLAAAVVVGIGALANWFQEQGAEKCEAGWKLEIAKKNTETVTAVAKKDREIAELTARLEGIAAEAELARRERDVALEKQRETTPLSVSCDSCRIPNSRIWVRGSSGARAKAAGGQAGGS